MGKAQIIRKIHNAAIAYKNHFIGNTYMFVFDGKYIEVMFKKTSFLHLTGVDTKLSAENFYEHAILNRGLRPQEVMFGPNNPYDLADKKTQYLQELYKITITDVVIATDIVTMTFTYGIGITNLEFIVCLGDDTDLSGKLKSNCKVPYSFRVEEIDNNKFKDLYDVSYVFKKRTGTKKYEEITYGNIKEIENLPQEIRNNLVINLNE